MLTAITYNCTPDSLVDVDQTAFAESFENEVRVKRSYGDLEVNVTFTPDVKSEITAWSSDDYDADVQLENTIQAEFRRFADRAFEACCQAN